MKETEVKESDAPPFVPFDIEPSWNRVLAEELQKPYVTRLAAFVKQERELGAVYPPEDLVFNAFRQTPYDKVKVVIVGQDPYHGPGQAHGLSFSVPKGVAPPPSLRNIFKELAEDLHLPIPNHGCLLKWAKQGVLLLNATLTVRQATPLSHHNQGWETFTDAVIRMLAQKQTALIFVLWGKNALEKCKNVPELVHAKHHLLTAAHPSPYSASNGFFGCRHFSQINDILKKQGQEPIDWTLD